MSWYKTFHKVKMGSLDINLGVTVWMSRQTMFSPAEFEIEDIEPVDKIYSVLVSDFRQDIIDRLYSDCTFIVNEEDILC